MRYSGRKFGDYVIEKAIGEGRYGICLLAHSSSGSQVIIKCFKSASIKKNKERAVKEAVVLSQINHIAVPKMLGIVQEKNFYGFILEKKPGDTVESLIFKKKHRFSNSEIFDILSQLIDIISYLHNKGLIHGDIRPPNVLIDNGIVYLIDFGLSSCSNLDRCTYGLDFSYLGDFILYLFYSTYKFQGGKRLAWYDELDLSFEQERFLKKLLCLEEPYSRIEMVKKDFNKAFGPG